MSRHRIVKGLDLADELNDFDGGDVYDDDTEVDEGTPMSDSDRAKLQTSTATVRLLLEPDLADLPRKEIEETLWYYYFDVDQSVTWLRKKHSSSAKAKPSKDRTTTVPKKRGVEALPRKKPASPPVRVPAPSPCTAFSAADFFQDSPWFNIPLACRGELISEPLCPHGGLLGGSSSGSKSTKPSKLAALAEARKKKDEEKKTRVDKENAPPARRSGNSISSLQKLHVSRTSTIPSTDSCSLHPSGDGTNTSVSASTLSLSGADRRESNPLPNPSRLVPPGHRSYDHSSEPPDQTDQTDTLQSAPSSFASAIFGRNHHHHYLPSSRTIPPSLSPLTLSATTPQPDLSNAFTEPSPDDVVLAAQAAKDIKSATAHTGTDHAVNGTAEQLRQTTLKEPTQVKSKHLDVVAEYRKTKRKSRASFVVIGHVDHGKSTLMGRLLYDLKVVDARTIERYRKEAEKVGKSSFALAWVLDQTSEERNRGVTMDVAMNKFETEKTKFTILDAPGHRDFIPNMIAGASQADFAVLVIDAGPNAFESGLKGQTREHALLVRSMGVPRVIVAINKMDTVQWSEDRFDEVRQQTMAFLTIAGFRPNNLSFVPCSGLTGENIVKSTDVTKVGWYSGPSLIDLLDQAEALQQAIEKPLRFTINDIFRGGIQNPLSTSGRLDAGNVQVGDNLLAVPSDEPATVKAIEVDDDLVPWAVAGQIATIHLVGIDPNQLKPGDMLCQRISPIKSMRSFTAKILSFDHLTPMPVEIHRGRLHVPGRICKLLATIDKATGEAAKRTPRIAVTGSIVRVHVSTDMSVPLEEGMRIVLRAGSETVGAGVVE